MSLTQVGDSKRCECSKGAPWPYAAESAVDDDSFPIYMRRSPEDGGSSFVNDKGLVVTNQWTISYNKQILLLWDGHANLKIVTSVINVKYIYKYEFKGKGNLKHILEFIFAYFKVLIVCCLSWLIATTLRLSSTSMEGFHSLTPS